MGLACGAEGGILDGDSREVIIGFAILFKFYVGREKVLLAR